MDKLTPLERELLEALDDVVTDYGLTWRRVFGATQKPDSVLRAKDVIARTREKAND